MNTSARNNTLVLTPRNLVVGIGCNRTTSGSEIEETVQNVLDRAQLSFEAIKKIATVSWIVLMRSALLAASLGLTMK